MAHMWRSQDNFQDSVLSIHCVVSGGRIPVIRLDSRCLNSLAVSLSLSPEYSAIKPSTLFFEAGSLDQTQSSAKAAHSSQLLPGILPGFPAPASQDWNHWRATMLPWHLPEFWESRLGSSYLHRIKPLNHPPQLLINTNWEWALGFQKPKPDLCLSSFLLPADSDVELSAPLQHHVWLCAALLPAITIID